MPSKPPKQYVDMRGEPVPLDTDFARQVARAFNVPDAIVGIPTPRWRQLLQRFTRRA